MGCSLRLGLIITCGCLLGIVKLVIRFFYHYIVNYLTLLCLFVVETQFLALNIQKVKFKLGKFSQMHVSTEINPFQTNEFFHKAESSKARMVHCIYLGITGYNF